MNWLLRELLKIKSFRRAAETFFACKLSHDSDARFLASMKKAYDAREMKLYRQDAGQQQRLENADYCRNKLYQFLLKTVKMETSLTTDMIAGERPAVFLSAKNASKA